MMAHRSSSETVTLEFLFNLLQDRQGINVQQLSGYFSQLPPKIRKECGCSLDRVKSLLAKYPDTFFVDNDDNVWTSLGKPKLQVKAAERKNNLSVPKRIMNVCKKQKQGSDNSLENIKGVVIRLFPKYGFISVKEPLHGTVYFDVNVFEDGLYRDENLTSLGLKVGSAVELSAISGPGTCKAKYRATKVKRLSHYENLEDLDSSEKVQGIGTIHRVFDSYGFLIFGRKQRAYFHVSNIVRPESVTSIYSLKEILAPDETVHFIGKLDLKTNASTKWIVVEMRIKHFEKDMDKFISPVDDEYDSGEEIYMSDPEDDCNTSKTQQGSQINDTLPVVHDTFNSEDPPFGDNKNEIDQMSPWSCSVDSLPKLFCTKGKFLTCTDSIGKIFVDDQYAYVCNDVFYVSGQKIMSFLLEVDEGSEVSFNAVRYNGIYLVTLAWIGDRPSGVEDNNSFKHSFMKTFPFASEDLKNKTCLPLSVDIYQSVRGVVDQVLEYIGYLRHKGRKIMFMDCVYINGKKVNILNEELHVGNEVKFNYMSCQGINGGEVYEEVTLVWVGRKPGNVKEMTPEEFLAKIKREHTKAGC